MRDRSEPGVRSVCCLLRDLTPGGSAWQWIRLLGRHVERGGRATILAPTGALVEPARAAGIVVVETPPWVERDPTPHPDLWAAVGEHDAAIVQWEQGVLEGFEPALEACGRAALSMHQAPGALSRWFGPPTVASARAALERAVDDPRAVTLVRGHAHRRQVAAVFGVPSEALQILPASVPVQSLTFQPARDEPRELLAMTRLSPEKAAIIELAVNLARASTALGRSCRLTIAGDGPWRSRAVELCESRLQPGSWQIEGSPGDPIARLAAADLVVAQGLTTLEAAALGRRVVVARSLGEAGPSGVVLTPDSYNEAARDPFGEPRLTEDARRLWEEILAVGEPELSTLRQLVEGYNSLDAASQALSQALTATGDRSRLRRLIRRRLAPPLA
jgi:hypothetical protein